MEAQYYVPTIDEFHIGFECEKQSQELIGKELRKKTEIKLVMNIDYDMERDLTFEKHIINAIDIQRYDLNPHLLTIEIRVKRLDRQDIEECGWEIDKHNNYYFKVNENWGYSLYYDNEEKVWSIDNGKEYEMWVQYFKGTIRNKSELKKLMQMLNIK